MDTARQHDKTTVALKFLMPECNGHKMFNDFTLLVIFKYWNSIMAPMVSETLHSRYSRQQISYLICAPLPPLMQIAFEELRTHILQFSAIKQNCSRISVGHTVTVEGNGRIMSIEGYDPSCLLLKMPAPTVSCVCFQGSHSRYSAETAILVHRVRVDQRSPGRIH